MLSIKAKSKNRFTFFYSTGSKKSSI